MQVKIELSGPQASGKTVLAEFIGRKLQPFCVDYTITKGSQDRGPKNDSIILKTSPELLAKLADS